MENKKVVTIPYVHRISHGFKGVVSGYGVSVIFPDRNKLSQTYRAVKKRVRQKKKKEVTVVP